MRKHLLSIAVFALLSNMASHAVNINGIEYLLDGTEATVIFLPEIDEKGDTIYGGMWEGEGIYKSGYKEKVIIPNKVSYEGIEYTVTSIGENAFYSSNELTGVILPETIKKIGAGAFAKSGLLDIVIPELTEIQNKPGYFGVFWLCKSLQKAQIPESWTNIPPVLFSGCESLTEINFGPHLTSIGGSAFYGCAFKNVVLPNSITELDYYAFSDCKNLEEIVLPQSLTTIKDAAFEGCQSLKSIDLPSSLSILGSYAFKGCTSLVSITFPDRINYGDSPVVGAPDGYAIAHYTCSGCTNLTDVNIPESISIIHEGAFADCGFTEFNMPSGVKFVGEDVFEGCNISRFNITDMSAWCSIYFHENPLQYADGLFLNGVLVTDFVAPEGVKEIGIRAFSGYKALKSITLPSTVTKIGKSAFENCTGLTSVNLSNSITRINERAFEGCTGLTEFNFPGTLTYVGYRSFYGCTGFTSLEFPNSLKAIDEDSFYGCTELKNVLFGESIASIAYGAFSECYNLNSVTCLNPEVPYLEDAFDHAEKDTLYVPTTSVDKYKADGEWGKFYKVIGKDFSGINDVVSDSDLSISVNGNEILISDSGRKVRIFTLDGVLVQELVSDGSSITVPHSGVYIVTVNEVSRKIIVR